MLWVVVMAVIAVLGLLMVVFYARWLWHKASDVMGEVAVVTDRLGQLGELLARIQPPDRSGGYVVHEGSLEYGDGHDVVDDEDDEHDDWAAEARELRLSQQSAEGSLSAPAARHARGPGDGSAT